MIELLEGMAVVDFQGDILLFGGKNRDGLFLSFVEIDPAVWKTMTWEEQRKFVSKSKVVSLQAGNSKEDFISVVEIMTRVIRNIVDTDEDEGEPS